MSQTYSAKSAAVRAAKKALGADAIETRDFAIETIGDRFTWFAPEGGPTASPLDEPVANAALCAGATKEEALALLGAAEAGKAMHTAMLEGASPEEALALLGTSPTHVIVDEIAAEAPPEGKKAKAPNKRMVEALARAERGELPEAPDFSADTHKRWRPRLAAVVAMAEAGDLKGLKRYEIKPISTSPKAIDRYRNLAVAALEARKRGAAGAEASELLS